MYLRIKRAADVLLSLGLLLLLSFPMFLIAVAIRCDSQGPVFFRQVRLGRGLRPFAMFKFRTMYTDAPHDCPSHLLCGEMRRRAVTRVGAFLRRTSLDELPQLWNVLWGDMSLVGPRPIIPNEYAVHALRAVWGATRLRPGITGLAQTHGRDDRGCVEKARMDAEYAANVSPVSDICILLRTALAVVGGNGCN